jgi:hypothetical protein
MQRARSQTVRIWALAAVILVGLGALAASASAPSAGAKRGPLYLISSPISVMAGDSVRASVVNLGSRTLRARITVVDGTDGTANQGPPLNIAPGRVGTYRTAITSDTIILVQVGFDSAPSTGTYRAALEVNNADGDLILHVRYSTDDGATFPIAN